MLAAPVFVVAMGHCLQCSVWPPHVLINKTRTQWMEDIFVWMQIFVHLMLVQLKVFVAIDHGMAGIH